MATAKDLYTVFFQKAGIEVVEADEKPNKLRLICRLQKSFGDQWKLVMHRLLTAETGAPWKIDISKKYFLRANQVFYGWRIILDGDSLPQHYETLMAIISSSPTATRAMVEEVPLVGASPNRNTRTNVGAVGTVAVGPGARRMG